MMFNDSDIEPIMSNDSFFVEDDTFFNETLIDQEDLNCPEFTEYSTNLLNEITFWVEGVLSCSIAIAGFFGNVGSTMILSGKEMRNSFNWLLIALACFDNIYLLGSILESFRKDFQLESHTHVILFPYLLYPMQTIAMTGSILMTVAIAFERYVAVHYPLNYNQAVNDVNALRQRIIKFLLPVCGLSIMFNVTKFFEATYKYAPVNGTMINNTLLIESDNQVDLVPILEPTALRTNPIYSIYFNWFRFIAIGVIPFALLVLFYAKIYADIQNRRKNTQYKKKQAAARLLENSKTLNSLPPTVGTSRAPEATTRHEIATKANCHDEVELKVFNKTTYNHNTSNTDVLESNLEKEEVHVETEKSPLNKGPAEPSLGNKIVSFSTEFLKPTSNKSEPNETNNDLDAYEDYESSTDLQAPALTLANTNNTTNNIPAGGVQETTTHALSQRRRNRSMNRKSKAKANAKRRRMEDQMASIFMGYILVFLICHSPRLMLNIYELATIRDAVACSSAHHQPFPAWSLMVMCFSHLFLVLNSSINILIYCVMSTKFREEACRFWKRMTRRYFTCCSQNY